MGNKLAYLTRLFAILSALLTKGNFACQPPDVPTRGYYYPHMEKYQAGDTVEYYCMRGYDRDGSSVRTCQLNGKWTDDTPFCDGPMKLKNPTASSYEFDAELATDGDKETCLISKRATGESFKVFLEFPAVIHRIRFYYLKGRVKLAVKLVFERKAVKIFGTMDRQLEEDQWITLTCDGDVMADSIYVEDTTEVQNTLRLCEVEIFAKDRVWCDNPPNTFILNGWLEVARDKGTLACAQGFTPGENKRLVCDNMEWSESVLRCDEILCGRVLLDLIGGDWKLIGTEGKFSIGSEKKLKCEQNYVMVGEPDTIQCQSNGTWSTSAAKCEKKKQDSYGTMKSVAIVLSSVGALLILSAFVAITVFIIRKKHKQLTFILNPDGNGDTATVFNEPEYSSVAYDGISVRFSKTTSLGSSPRGDHILPPPYTPVTPPKPSGSSEYNQEALLRMMKASPLYNR